MLRSERFNIKKIAIVGILGGISAVLGLTPLGFIPVGPTRATIMHIPVIIGAIMEGPVVGALVGLIFGLSSIFQAIMSPTPVSFVFLNPLVSILPRVLIGIVSYYVYELFKKMEKKASKTILLLIWIFVLCYLIFTFATGIMGEAKIWESIFSFILIVLTFLVGYYSNKKLQNNAIEVVASAAAGTLTNTLGVLSFIYLLYGQDYALKLGLDPDKVGKFILGIGITNGIPEIIVAIIIVTSVVASLEKRA
ncbi:ECF transporter S component [Anaerosalibacter massiliensis]|mgnify:CR=1 FL=1|uniref:ECF transporter S component n=1 Tax=Anaerosalibacter massiliensis TaxID=1347392 RepID=A0A9X2S8B0_9FIRM|nr:ECF transporter S component [Anaerosalibacter massiliensis]MCR2045647.1 ECF transporter S component [Anaerosalibacter massiliensis]